MEAKQYELTLSQRYYLRCALTELERLKSPKASVSLNYVVESLNRVLDGEKLIITYPTQYVPEDYIPMTDEEAWEGLILMGPNG